MDSFYSDSHPRQRVLLEILENLQSVPSAIYRRALLGVVLFIGIIITSGCASSGDSNLNHFPAQTEHSNTPVSGRQGSMDYNGSSVSTITSRSVGAGVVVPNTAGGMTVVTGDTPESQDPSYVDAREFKLRIRELGEQLVSETTDPYLRSAVAMPTAFVSLGNFNVTSALGQLISEQLIYEFNQRGFPIKEYRLDASIIQRKNGEFYLSREHLERVAVNNPGTVVLVGTYQEDQQAIFINARLVRPSDGKVLRTGNLVLNSNPLIKRLAKKRTNFMHLQGKGIPIKARGSSGQQPSLNSGNPHSDLDINLY